MNNMNIESPSSIEVQDPSLICFVAELMKLAKEGYELDAECYPNNFGGLYHTKVKKVDNPKQEEKPTIEETVVKPKPGPKPKKVA